MKRNKFRQVPGYEGLYGVSSDGKVWSLNYKRSGKIQDLKPRKTKKGYMRVELCKEGNRKKFTVHRLVWTAFNGTIPEGMQINHIDENKTHNSLENLELVTPSENTNWGTRNERAAAKLSKAILQFTKTGELIAEYPSFMEAWRQTGISHGNICQCCKGNPNYTNAGGFVWKYK